jgi:hypothetical protein
MEELIIVGEHPSGRTAKIYQMKSGYYSWSVHYSDGSTKANDWNASIDKAKDDIRLNAFSIFTDNKHVRKGRWKWKTV